MARRDLDAALQLLVDRAQYITGATGAAIALRRTGRNDMQCRASTGSNAPELGALLSTEYGLSGESVRTRQALRCDDAERDARVNREVCRHLGIASVVVMPVVNDDGVLGVFELFSGEVNAFGERDLSAVQRLSEMVETAVRMAEATEKLPEKLKASETAAPETALAEVEVEEDKILDAPVQEALDAEKLAASNAVPEELVLEDVGLEEAKPAVKAEAEAGVEKAGLRGFSSEAGPAAISPIEDLAATAERTGLSSLASLTSLTSAPSAPALSTPSSTAASPTSVSSTPIASAPDLIDPKIASTAPVSEEMASTKLPQGAAPVAAPTVSAQREAQKITPPEAAAEKAAGAPLAAPPAERESPAPAPSKKSLFWSAALNPAGGAESPADSDQSHVPPVLRGLRKCEACGFPVSAGRALCVECEEKKWRGQLKGPQAQPRQTAGAATAPLAAPKAEARTPVSAPAGLASAPAPAAPPFPPGAPSAPVPASSAAPGKELKIMEQAASASPHLTKSARSETAAVRRSPETAKASPEFVLSAGLEQSQSWFSANKYILIALLLAAAVIAALVFLR